MGHPLKSGILKGSSFQFIAGSSGSLNEIFLRWFFCSYESKGLIYDS